MPKWVLASLMTNAVSTIAAKLCVLQSDYASGGLDTAYSGGQAAFAAPYGAQTGYPGNVSATGQDAYAANALYSQGFATGSQVWMPHHLSGLLLDASKALANKLALSQGAECFQFIYAVDSQTCQVFQYTT